jgi:hypothetical protein
MPGEHLGMRREVQAAPLEKRGHTLGGVEIDIVALFRP